MEAYSVSLGVYLHKADKYYTCEQILVCYCSMQSYEWSRGTVSMLPAILKVAQEVTR